MVIVYRWKWRWMPVHNVYWSNSNFRKAICIMTITHSKTDKNYTACFCSKLTPIHNKWHTRLSKKLRKPPFRFTRIINWIYTFFFCKCVILTDTISFLPYFHFHFWIKLFLFLVFRRTFCWLSSSLNVKGLKIIFQLGKVQLISRLMSGSENYVKFQLYQIISYLKIKNHLQFIFDILEQFFFKVMWWILTSTSIWCSSTDGLFVSFSIPSQIQSLFVTVP